MSGLKTTHLPVRTSEIERGPIGLKSRCGQAGPLWRPWARSHGRPVLGPRPLLHLQTGQHSISRSLGPFLLPSLRTLVMTQDCLPISGPFTGSHLHSPFGHVRSLTGPGDQRVDAFGGCSSANRNGCATVSHCCYDHMRGRGGGGRPPAQCAHSGCLTLHMNTSFRGR